MASVTGQCRRTWLFLPMHQYAWSDLLGSREAGRDVVRTISQVREAEGPGTKEMPRGSYREIFDKGKYRDAWALAQRSPLCVQRLQLVGVGMPPVNPPKKGYSSRSNPVKRGRPLPLLDRKQVRLVPRSHSNRRVRPAEVVEKPKPLKPRGGLSHRFSKAWADVVDDDDQAGALVSYAESSGDSGEEETNNARHLWETFLRERDSQRTEARHLLVLRAPMKSRKNRFTLAKGATKRRGGRPAKK